MLHLAHRAFWPARIPFPVMHVDTGHNFDEVIEFRDRAVADFGVELVVASVQDSIDAGRVREDTGPRARATRCRPSRCSTPSPSTASTPCSAAPAATRSGPGPRSGSCQPPRRVRPVGPEEPAARAVGDLQHPPPPWRAPAGLPAVELDRARHLALHRRAQRRPAAAVLRPPSEVFRRDGMLMAVNRHVARWSTARRLRGTRPLPHDRRRHVHGRRRSPSAFTVEDIVAETAVARVTERGATRADDRISEAGMEDRKQLGYF